MRIVWIYLSLLFSFTLLSVGVIALVPNDCIQDNADTSARMLQQEGNPMELGVPLLAYDNFTDAVMLDIMISTDSQAPLYSAMLNPFHYNEHDGLIATQVLDVLHTEASSSRTMQSYGTYWHGYQVTLRPLLSIMSYSGIRTLNHIVLYILAICVLVLLWNKAGWYASLTFLATLMVGYFPMIPNSFQYSTCFLISLAASVVMLSYKPPSRNYSALATSFFVIGAICVYFDFLTTPMLTFCFPLIALLISSASSKNPLKVVVAGIGWLAGYSLLWLSKWVLATIVTGQNVLNDARESILIRSSDDCNGQVMSITHLCQLVCECLSTHPIMWLIPIIIFIAVAMFVFYLTHFRQATIEHMWLLLLACASPVWFIVLRNHSFVHLWFTWRTWLPFIWACLLFLYYVPATSIRHKQTQNNA